METVGEIMEKLIQKVLVQRGECPECGQPLYGWRTKNPDGSERCKPTCMQCGYKALRVQEDLQTERIYNESLKARAINFSKVVLLCLIKRCLIAHCRIIKLSIKKQDKRLK